MLFKLAQPLDDLSAIDDYQDTKRVKLCPWSTFLWRCGQGTGLNSFVCRDSICVSVLCLSVGSSWRTKVKVSLACMRPSFHFCSCYECLSVLLCHSLNTLDNESSVIYRLYATLKIDALMLRSPMSKVWFPRLCKSHGHLDSSSNLYLLPTSIFSI